MNRRLPIREIALTFAVLLVVSPFAAYAMPAMVGADQSYIVLTGSMKPTYAPGDVVFVTAMPAAAISAGDVITFTRGEGPTTTHRVIEVVDASGDIAFRTQGDNNEDADPALVRADQVVGVVTLSVPYVGTVITAADSQYGFIALVVVPFLLLALDVAYGAIRSRRTVATAADEPADLPAVYDPVTAAQVYYEHANEALAEAQAAGGNTSFTGRDMTAAIAVAFVLLAYAAWNAYWQFTTFGQPRPETMSIVSGALVGIAFLVYLRVTTVTVDGPATAAEPLDDRTDSRAADASVTFAAPGLAPRVAFEEEVRDAD